MLVDVYDPWAAVEEVKHEYNISICGSLPDLGEYAAIILAVAHQEFKSLKLSKSDKQVVFDVKGFLPKDLVDARL